MVNFLKHAMMLVKMLGSSLFHFTTLIFVVGYLLGVLNLHFSDKSNHCAMTYMYEYPQFVRIHFEGNYKYPQYGLYAYSEGRLTENARKLRFDGIPVLFLPGNSGSHMQVRSLASVALRKALSGGYEYHFDFYTISFNEELSGLYAGTLNNQVEFASRCVHKILSLYSSNKYTNYVPSSVILIGHSMGGVVASKLLALPSTIDKTKIAISLAAPLEAPIILFDYEHDNFYLEMKEEWIKNVYGNEEYRDNKVLISIGSGPRDILVPSGLTSSNESFINALTTAIPGVWVSPDHVCIVWCKQLVMAINRYLFSLVDFRTQQIVVDTALVKDRAKQFFVANRSMNLDTTKVRVNVTMVADAFWYEDNRRLYQVIRPDIDKMTYLMIRLVAFPQNRFVAIEAVNLENHEWVFGCNAKFTYNVHRYCKHATPLSELSRWTGAAADNGKRKLATINLHTLKQQNPDWTHVIVKVAPTRKPITLSVDINDLASRQVDVKMPSLLAFGKTTIISQTEPESLYYELVLKNFNTLPEAYLLYVEPTAVCKEYHASAEVHVPWAKDHEYFHYFTPLKRSPMKLRLFKTNPNITSGKSATEHVKVTLLLDPRCTYTVSIGSSWYHRLAQMVRHYTPLLIPYISGIVIMCVGINLRHFNAKGTFVSVHTTLADTDLKPYYVVPLAKIIFFCIGFLPYVAFIENSTYANKELQYISRVGSLLAFPAYMAALGFVNVGIAAVMAGLVFSSQIDRIIVRIFWRGAASFAERIAHALWRVPLILSVVMLGSVPVACGAAALTIGAAFYAFMIARMFEDYFEDFTYKHFSKVAAKFCRLIKRKQSPKKEDVKEIKWRNLDHFEQEGQAFFKKPKKSYVVNDDDLCNVNFHVMMFSLWLVSTLLNLPALLAWARNFKYDSKLDPDTSFFAGIVLSACSILIWQTEGPRKHSSQFTVISNITYALGIIVITLGPFTLVLANYSVTLIFLAITAQLLFDYEMNSAVTEQSSPKKAQKSTDKQSDNSTEKDKTGVKKNSAEENTDAADKSTNAEGKSTDTEGSEENEPQNNADSENCDVCDESRIYTIFKNLREKLSFNNE